MGRGGGGGRIAWQPALFSAARPCPCTPTARIFVLTAAAAAVGGGGGVLVASLVVGGSLVREGNSSIFCSVSDFGRSGLWDFRMQRLFVDFGPNFGKCCSVVRTNRDHHTIVACWQVLPPTICSYDSPTEWRAYQTDEHNRDHHCCQLMKTSRLNP